MPAVHAGQRLKGDGGSNLNVMDVAIPVKRPNEYLQSITVRPEMDDDRYVHKA